MASQVPRLCSTRLGGPHAAMGRKPCAEHHDEPAARICLAIIRLPAMLAACNMRVRSFITASRLLRDFRVWNTRHPVRRSPSWVKHKRPAVILWDDLTCSNVIPHAYARVIPKMYGRHSAEIATLRSSFIASGSRNELYQEVYSVVAESRSRSSYQHNSGCLPFGECDAPGVCSRLVY